ncbi:expressed unknown protein [Seminavis robusta]|uniref:Peptidase M10 metallopeptidase domain-containing protein n=1 Tax=Seminavis robusta TaxID=568900 RepID=A0A9N8DN27_9STRA|nr:expressed unknown protein [Seminavis robusta]|eukprot:Sro146_g067600.1 n/a (452) ;mRNA; r:66368-67723
MMPSAPTESMLNDEAAMLEHYRSTRHVDDDAALALRLQQEEQDAQYARDIEEQCRREERLQREHQQQNAHLPPVESMEDPRLTPEDAQLACDEDLARQYALAEERALAAREQQAAVATPSWRRRLCTSVIPCAIIGVGVLTLYLVLRYTGDGEGIQIPGIGARPPWMSDSDPFDGLTPGEVAKWRNRGSNDGLQLTILNALSADESWDEIFPLVVDDWDDGTPDALVLTVRQADPDPKCDAVSGASKICNGNYGDTQWKGINIAILQMNFIVASTSKMNEFYLARASDAQRRYTMCHEMGHSFGLPHTDEDFFNKDLGNCMDYTSSPKNNMQPDETNYQFLADLYGSIESTEVSSPNPANPPQNENQQDDGNRRRLRHVTDTNAIPMDIQSKLQEILPAMENYNVNNDSNNDTPPPHKWRLLHSSKQGQAHEMDLGHGWKVQMHKLLHVDD